MYISRLVSWVLADSSHKPSKESETDKVKKVLLIARLEPTISCLQDWHSNRLSYRVRSDWRYLKLNVYTFPNMYSHIFNQKLDIK